MYILGPEYRWLRSKKNGDLVLIFQTLKISKKFTALLNFRIKNSLGNLRLLVKTLFLKP